MVTAILTAGGIGKRMGKDTYKQFLQIHGIPILALSIQQFQNHPKIDDIMVVVPEDSIAQTQSDIVQRYKFTKVSQVIAGGKERQFSVENAIKLLSEETTIVMIHDGVRPFINRPLISDLLKQVKSKQAVIPALKPKETVKRVQMDVVKNTINRSGLVLVQTPQVFDRKLLETVYRTSDLHHVQVTDDASLFEQQGIPVFWVPGLEQNIKITTPADLELAEFYYDKFLNNNHN